MAPIGWVVRGGCRVVVTAGDIVLVTVVGRIVVVVLSGVEVTGPVGRKTVEGKQSSPQTKYSSLPFQVFSYKILIFKNAYAITIPLSLMLLCIDPILWYLLIYRGSLKSSAESFLALYCFILKISGAVLKTLYM